MVVRQVAFVAWVIVGVGGCDRPSPPRARVPDKAALYGDPGLLPTREGEAARRELAMSAELAQVVAATGWIESPHVDVEIAEATTTVIVGGVRNAAAPEDLEQQVLAVAYGIAGDGATVTMVLGDADAPKPARAMDASLLLAVLGLGASLSLMIDRAWRRRRRAMQRGGSRARR